MGTANIVRYHSLVSPMFQIDPREGIHVSGRVYPPTQSRIGRKPFIPQHVLNVTKSQLPGSQNVAGNFVKKRLINASENCTTKGIVKLIR